MAGILNKKQRVMDFILTSEGKAQVEKGDLNIAYASVSDMMTFYEKESSGAASDASNRIFFESSPRHQDRIVVESDFGVITDFLTEEYELAGYNVLTSPDAPRSAHETIELTGSQSSQKSDTIITGITKNFYDNQLISNEDIFSSTPGFSITDNEVNFTPTVEFPIDVNIYYAADDMGTSTVTAPQLASHDPVMKDWRFSHFPNFKFMPPTTSGDKKRQLGLYPNLNQAEVKTYEELTDILENCPVHEISFDPTSRDNNIFIQPFEFYDENGVIKKMSVIDFGTFPNEKQTSAGVRVFFVGNLKKSADGTTKFFNVFTVELDV